MKRKLIPVVGLAAIMGLLQPAVSPAADSVSIYDTLLTMKEHTILTVAVTEAKEVATLNGDGPYTLFAPTDAAFKKLDDATIKKIATDKAAVRKLLRTHVMPGKLTTAELNKLGGKTHRTLHGNEWPVQVLKEGYRVGGAKLLTTDIQCSNGVIHVIDTVLPLPKE
jgi:uncharacterized surface protein with fasciclin (FAS1) repeats